MGKIRQEKSRGRLKAVFWGLWHNHSDKSGLSLPPCVCSIVHAPRLRTCLILFFGRDRGCEGRATAKPTGSRRSSADGFAVKMEQTKAGAGLSNPIPRFLRRNGNGKNPDGQGTA